MQLLCFTVDEHRYGIASDSVLEIVRAVAITPLPGAPAVIEGVIDVRGVIVPVFDLRARFGQPSRAVTPADHFILAQTPSRVAALHVDHVQDLVDAPARAAGGMESQVPTAQHIAGAATLADGMVLIQDVATFLSAAESESFETVLTAASTAARRNGALTAR
jgi:purine-binding chemotaxis protein CheW